MTAFTNVSRTKLDSLSLNVGKESDFCWGGGNNREIDWRNLSPLPILLLSWICTTAKNTKKEPKIAVFQRLQQEHIFSVLECGGRVWSLLGHNNREKYWKNLLLSHNPPLSSLMYICWEGHEDLMTAIFQLLQQNGSFSVCHGGGDVWSVLWE